MRTITVRGTGKATAKPDYVVLILSLNTTDKKYQSAMDKSSERIERLQKSLEKAGFEKDTLKTTYFDVNTNYNNKKDYKGDYHRVLEGYEVKHELKISFDFDTDILSKAINAISDSVSEPELLIDFTLKDPSEINNDMLKSAAENARKKAEILCSSSGTTLGELINIDYDWGELDTYSPTKLIFHDHYHRVVNIHATPNIIPEEINVSDTVIFVWEIT